MNALRENVQYWLQYDANIQKYNKSLKELKTKKSIIEEKILKEIESKELKNTKFKMSNNNIYYHTTYTLPPLNNKLLETVLSKYTSKDNVSKILKDIEQQREGARKPTISLKRKEIKERKKSTKRSKIPVAIGK